MKFAKEIEDDLVPEWRAKYINYKHGKKKVKAVSRALRNANRTPRLNSRPPLPHVASTASIPYTHYDFNARAARAANTNATPSITTTTNPKPEDRSTKAPPLSLPVRKMSTTMFTLSPPIRLPESQPESNDGREDGSDEERTPLKRVASQQSVKTNTPSYGSISQTGEDARAPPAEEPETPGRMPRLSLPDPALDPGRGRAQSPELGPVAQQRSRSERTPGIVRMQSPERPEAKKHHSHPLMKHIFQPKANGQSQQAQQTQHSPGIKSSAKQKLKTIFQSKNINSPEFTLAQQQAYNDLDVRQDEFFDFLDKELDKVEKFYQMKEDEARERLDVLRAQLHEHRDQRARDIKLQKQGHRHFRLDDGTVGEFIAETHFPNITEVAQHDVRYGHLLKNVFKQEPKVGKTSKAMNKLASPPVSPETQANDNKKDYTRKRPTQGNESVPHKFAKRRLKLALQEFYRGMELLKSYALLNRTGFRKINKKYDKAVNARPPLRYLNEKVADAHFVKSTVIDEYLVAVEDLYARYFERGNRKIAVNKLRSKGRQGDQSGPSFRNGLFLAAGVGLGIAGLYNASVLLFNGTPELQVITSYLLQMYAGYFLALLLFLIFVLDCRIWTSARINYVFVFEYDTRHVMDWRQLAEIPSFFVFLLGLAIWLNFEFGEFHTMFRYWPVVLFSLTLLVMAFPFKLFYYHSRKWWGFSNFRLLFAGIYPVEFRDFFLGDMYCSETYTMSQLEVFFCVYRWNWDNPPQCNSNHSRLLGFLTTLPAIWRFLQCVRRYKDSGNWFPHLANCAKYSGNILYYMALSLYRLNLHSPDTWKYKVVFILFAALNGLYCSIWDVFMDWSLGNFFSKHIGLRDHLAYRKKWVYYVAIIFNTILRHQWICYAIFAEDLQHSAAMSFFVALAEVIRRGVWTLFRVENEHTNNVAKFRASRDIPLPYSIPQSPETKARADGSDYVRKRRQVTSDGRRPADETTSTTTSANYDIEQQTTTDSGSTVRRRRTNTPALRALQRVGTVIAAAHSQDFQKRKRPEVVGQTPEDEAMIKDHDHDYNSSDEDDDDRHEIEQSIIDEDDDYQHHHSKTATDEAAQAHFDDGGEGSSSDSQPTHERQVDVRSDNDDDLDQPRQSGASNGTAARPRGGVTNSSGKEMKKDA